VFPPDTAAQGGGPVRSGRAVPAAVAAAHDADHGAAAIEAVDVTKAYGSTLALDGVSFRALAGKVTVLLGENGAGKSTLMRILAGEIAPDSGHIACAGRPVRLRSPRDARHQGVALIHQELSLFPALTVAENIFIGGEHRRGGLVDSRRHLELAGEILARLDRHIDPRARVGELAVGQQQIVEIAKALAHDARVMIMDEPTSALSNAEVDALFDIVRELTTHGVAVVYISHRMDVIFRIGDILVVMRDGRRIAEARACDVDMEWVSETMLGSRQREAMRRMKAARGERRLQDRAEILEVRNLFLASPEAERLLLNDVSFGLRPGEILGVYGLLGAGKTELAETIAGLRPEATGACLVGGKPVGPGPAARIAAGIALVPEDRQRQAIVPTGSVSDNVTLSSLAAVSRLGIVSRRREGAAVGRMVEALSIRLHSGAQSIQALSGGNQQKTVVARALLSRPAILILDEPTRGIDVGAKAEIFEVMRTLAAEGLAVLFASSELPEIVAVSDRIIVLSRGQIRGIFDGAAVGEADLVKASVDDTPI
jgi:ABC-type sugar transport system ATPase subunit